MQEGQLEVPKFANCALFLDNDSRGHGAGAQSSRFFSFFGFCFAAPRAQPAIPALFLKRFGSCSGVALVKAANSRARDHLLLCFESKAGKVASINVLTGVVPFLRGAKIVTVGRAKPPNGMLHEPWKIARKMPVKGSGVD